MEKHTCRTGGIGPLGFPLVAGTNHEIIKSYGIPNPDGVAFRASFLIDKDGVIQHSTVNNLPLGRNVDEMLRLVDALQFSEEHGEGLSSWLGKKGDSGMKAPTEGVAEYLAENSAKL
ncbi:MAG: hypothetical protein Ct9H90mP25_5220 [Gammaproteobacteria bacterium]|nr:MAG: hypothetical protein Ct9H90mP25_5220 [Gammaproteobacteria bacterium]